VPDVHARRLPLPEVPRADRGDSVIKQLRGDLPLWQSRGQWWAVYLDWRDWWIGAYVSDRAVYVCPLPCLVIRRMRDDT
jgi:hypothetical protein